MKKFLLFAFMTFNLVCFAQDGTFLWPIKNAQAGENILFRPQEYIGNELNFGNLIIHAPKGTVVQAPANGVVTSFAYTYLYSLTRLSSWRITPTNFEKDIEAIQQILCPNQRCFNTDIDINFVSVGLGIRLENGRTMWINGLRPTRTFRTGERITRGDTIGTVGYVYHAILQPAISVAVSERNQTVGDPMSPFGLRSTFRKPEIRQPKINLTAEEAKNDFTILVDALKEGFPGLYDFVSEQAFEVQVSQALTQMQNGIRTVEFYDIVVGLLRVVRDNHLAVLSRRPTSPSNRQTYFASIYVGWLNDTLIVTRTHLQHAEHHKRQVIAVDGIPADSLKNLIKSYISGIEGNVESHRDFELATVALLRYFRYHPNTSPRENVTLTFDCGETVLFDGFRWSPGTPSPIVPQFSDFREINTKEISLEKLSDSVAYLGLPSFGITEVQQDEIAEFIASIAELDYQTLIIDLRNNRGGPDAVMQRLFSLIAQQPFYVWTYSQVNRRGGFDFFERTTNFGGVDNLFSEHIRKEGREGYFSYNTQTILPNENVNFNERVYVLINENSASASAVFAGLVHKYRRGVLVGRETGSAHHQIKALQTAILRLPNSQIDVNVPLVKIVFDTDTSRISFGRGVLPDFPLPLSLEELAFENGDAILNFAKQLIEHGYYLKEVEVLADDEKSNRLAWLILIIGCMVVVCLVIYVVNKRKLKS